MHEAQTYGNKGCGSFKELLWTDSAADLAGIMSENTQQTP